MNDDIFASLVVPYVILEKQLFWINFSVDNLDLLYQKQFWSLLNHESPYLYLNLFMGAASCLF